MLVILEGQPLAGQNLNALDRVAIAGCKNFPRAPRPRVPLTYRITDSGRGAAIRVENAHLIPSPSKCSQRYHDVVSLTVSFSPHLIIFDTRRANWRANRIGIGNQAAEVLDSSSGGGRL